MNETFTGAAQVDADASPQADGAPSAARIVTGLSRLPGSFSGRYAARIVTGLRLDCPAPPRAATRPASSPGSGWIARLLLGPLRGPHRHRAQAAAAAVRDQARARRRRRVTRRGYGDEFMDMNIDVDPDWGPPPGEDPVTSTVASDRGAGHLGFAGTARREAVADAAGMTTLAGDDFGDGPTTPMVPGSWDPDRDAPGSAEPGDRG